MTSEIQTNGLATNVKYPIWHKPVNNNNNNNNSKQLKILNSLTNEKNEFIPIEDNKIKFYICGPTVYDSAHLGHARAYVTFDIIRRVLMYHYNYDVNFVMNITDVDDKIILKARKNFLYNKYVEQYKDNKQQIIDDSNDAFRLCIEKQNNKIYELQQNLQDVTKTRYHDEYNDTLQNEQLKLEQLNNDKQLFDRAVNDNNTDNNELLAITKSVLSDMLDKSQGYTVTDQDIYRKHAAYYEAEFFEDMKSLNILQPDTITRVTEYIEQIKLLTQRIIDNGFAYEANGSVYMDTVAYQKSGYIYGKLAPNSVGNSELVSEGEGGLIGDVSREKRNPNDFVLWKKSKPGGMYTIIQTYNNTMTINSIKIYYCYTL